MRNIDFSLGFIVDREKLNNYMHIQSEFFCLLETSFGYTGINIKVPLEEDITKMKVKKIYIDNEGDEKVVLTNYQEYLDLLPIKEKNAKINDERYNTFLVFHSGKVIMSGLTAEYMRNVYYYFLSTIRKAFDKIVDGLRTIVRDPGFKKNRIKNRINNIFML